MKKMMMFILCAVISASTATAKDKVPEKKEPQQFFSFKFNGKNWKAAHHNHSGDAIAIEWTNNEPVTNWTELVTGNIYFVDTAQIDARRYANYFVEQIKPGSIDFSVKAIIDTPNEVVFEWSHKGSGKWPAQREVVHFFKGKDAIYRLAYSIKEKSYNKQKYDYWVNSIKEAKLVDK